jgi:hypothetical protein
MDCLDKCGPLRIDGIRKIIWIVVCIAIDLIAGHMSIAFYKAGEYLRVTVVTGHAKGRVSNPHII